MKIALLGLLFFAFSAMADDSASTLSNLQKEYKLTDTQTTSLKNSGLPDPQLAVVARLYSDLPKGSKTTIDDILKMRSEHMGWGEIAKKLGVPPKEIGQAVAAEHRQDEHHHHDGKDDDRDSKHNDREPAHHDHDENHHDHGKGH